MASTYLPQPLVSYWKFCGDSQFLTLGQHVPVKIGQQLLNKKIFEQFLKLGQKTKIVHYFDNSEWNFFFMAKISQVWLQFAYEANQMALSYQLYV